ncbi:MAG: hypothetical protein WA984_13990 [Phormidesmis sp.]
MSYLAAQVEESLGKRAAVSQDEAAFSIKCSIQMLKQGDRTGVVSQICYRPSGQGAHSVNGVFFNAKMLNALLTVSEVFVVKDLDGDHSYYLRMDTILLEDTGLPKEMRSSANSSGARSSSSMRSLISQLLNHVTQDTDILLKYFRHPLP